MDTAKQDEPQQQQDLQALQRTIPIIHDPVKTIGALSSTTTLSAAVPALATSLPRCPASPRSTLLIQDYSSRRNMHFNPMTMTQEEDAQSHEFSTRPTPLDVASLYFLAKTNQISRPPFQKK
jgi:hypothetical protein